MNWVLLLLVLGNLFLWSISDFEEPKEDPVKLQEEISQLEAQLPQLEQVTQWAKRAKEALDVVPVETPKGFINRVQSLAKVWKITLQETAQSGESPVYTSLSGVGKYQDIARLLTEIGKNTSVVVHKISLIVQDDLLVNARIEMAVRVGPFQGNSPSKDRIEPVQMVSQPLSLGRVELFGRESLPEKPVPGTPRIRYLGFYSGKDRPTGIMEENMKALLVQPGDRTPSGLRVKQVTPDFLEIQSTSEGKREWKIPLEKSR